MEVLVYELFNVCKGLESNVTHNLAVAISPPAWISWFALESIISLIWYFSVVRQIGRIRKYRGPVWSY